MIFKKLLVGEVHYKLNLFRKTNPVIKSKPLKLNYIFYFDLERRRRLIMYNVRPELQTKKHYYLLFVDSAGLHSIK